ncbi:MAG TPA: hypothetical protein VGJ98_00010 [Candidatus Eisenbacteria bacterium]
MNLRFAYTNRDSVQYKSLFHDNYEGSFIDQNDPFPQLVTYHKADEAMHIAFIAQSTASVDLVLASSLVRIIDLGDPEGWITIQNPFQQLQIYIGSEGHAIVPDNETIEMKFIPIPPGPSSPDTTYQIIKLTEIRRSITGS